MVEVWKDIIGYEGKYQVSNLGRIKSLQRWSGTQFYNREQILKTYTNKRNGYVYVYLMKNNKGKNIRVHKLVAQAFLINDNNYTDINHKDCNRTNNCVDNLEYCTRSYNIKYSFEKGCAKSNLLNWNKS